MHGLFDEALTCQVLVDFNSVPVAQGQSHVPSQTGIYLQQGTDAFGELDGNVSSVPNFLQVVEPVRS